MDLDGACQYEPVAEHAILHDLNERLLDLAGVQAGQTVIDLGCGTGAVSRALLARFPTGLDVVAVDPDRGMVDAARRSLVSEIRVIRASAEELDAHLPPEAADVVLMANAIHLVDDIPRAFGQLRRVLRPGGRLVFHTVFFEGSARRADRRLYWKLVLEAQRRARRLRPEVRRRVGSRPLAKRTLTADFYTEMMSRAGLTALRVERTPVELTGDLLLKVVSAPIFAAGALPGLPAEAAVEAVRAAAEDILRDAPIRLRRDWLYVLAERAGAR